jgi:hypothetical protein
MLVHYRPIGVAEFLFEDDDDVDVVAKILVPIKLEGNDDLIFSIPAKWNGLQVHVLHWNP